MTNSQHFHYAQFWLNEQQQIFYNQYIFLLLNWKNTQFKNKTMAICNERYAFNNFLEYFPSVTRASQILVCPNCPPKYQNPVFIRNIRYLGNFSGTGVNLSGERVVSLKPQTQIKLFHSYLLAKVIVSSFNSHLHYT